MRRRQPSCERRTASPPQQRNDAMPHPDRNGEGSYTPACTSSRRRCRRCRSSWSRLAAAPPRLERGPARRRPDGRRPVPRSNAKGASHPAIRRSGSGRRVPGSPLSSDRTSDEPDPEGARSPLRPAGDGGKPVQAPPRSTSGCFLPGPASTRDSHGRNSTLPAPSAPQPCPREAIRLAPRWRPTSAPGIGSTKSIPERAEAPVAAA